MNILPEAGNDVNFHKELTRPVASYGAIHGDCCVSCVTREELQRTDITRQWSFHTCDNELS